MLLHIFLLIIGVGVGYIGHPVLNKLLDRLHDRV